MTLSQDRADLIRRSWARVSGAHDELARSFYGRLFALDPRIEDLFAVTEMESQHGKFVTMMSEIVRLVTVPDGFAAVLRVSGARHRGYGVVPHHYRTVGEAFLWALERVTPGGLDEPTRAAWAEAYTHMARVMQIGAEESAGDRSSG